MVTYVAAALLAMVASLLMTPLVRSFARRIGAMDPPGGRKIHAASIPHMGGVAVAMASAIALGSLVFLSRATSASRLLFAPQPAAWLPILAGGALVFGVGLLDDLRPVPIPIKLVCQTAAAVIVLGLGVRIDHVTLRGVTYELSSLSAPLTVLWIVGITNAFNLVDGLDGLATGLAVIAAAACATLLVLRGESQSALVLLALLGAAVGFLPYNFNPATIFLGDSGSLLFGFVLAVTAITGSQKGATALAVAVPLLIFALPIVEALSSAIRRLAQGRHIFSADRQHIHHQLLAMGLSHRSTVLLLYGLSLGLSLLALASADFSPAR
jgi:UDP-GlcNAc:undecaprenyl-phosphate GlcNAc-1-phosphate transferase